MDDMLTLEDFRQAIEKRAQEVVKADAETKQRLAEVREKYEILKRLKDKNPKTTEDIEQAMQKVLCFGNLSFCCGSPQNPHGEGKNCIFRDGFLDALGWSYVDYEAYKLGCSNLFWRTLEKRYAGAI